MRNHLLAPTLRYCGLIVILLALSGCGGVAFSPEQIAIREALDSPPQGGVTDPDSVRVLQSTELNGTTFLLVSFDQLADNRQQECLFLYGVERSPVGTWMPTVGGGGCSIGANDEAVEMDPISQLGLNISSGSKQGDPGVSSMYAFVSTDKIVKMRVTWIDNVVQEVDVVNGSFIAVRAGQLNFNNVEGLDPDGQVLYDHQAYSTAPGKE